MNNMTDMTDIDNPHVGEHEEGPIIVGRRVISPPGAVIWAEVIETSQGWKDQIARELERGRKTREAREARESMSWFARIMHGLSLRRSGI